MEFLEHRGLELRCQLGVHRPDGLGSFRLDIVIMDEGVPILAVECDGAAYHRSLSARTRDRARQTQLERLDWRFHRVWSTNWWLFPDAEKQALLHAIEDAQRSETANRKVPAFGGTPRADVARRSAIPRRELGNEAAVQLTRPAVAPRAELRQPALFDELTEMLPKADRVRPVKTGPANEPAELHAWSRLPGWPDSVVGRRVRWNERGER